MDFVNENVIWFIVGGTILFMALIGFIAEKTDFGRKPKKVKEEKSETPVVAVAPIVEEVVNAPKEELKVENVIPTVEDLMKGEVEPELPALEETPVTPLTEEITPSETILPIEDIVAEEVVAPTLETVSDVVEPTLETVTEEVEPIVSEEVMVEPALEEITLEPTIEAEPIVEESKEEFQLPTLEEVLAENEAYKNQEVSEPEEQEEVNEDSLWKF